MDQKTRKGVRVLYVFEVGTFVHLATGTPVIKSQQAVAAVPSFKPNSSEPIDEES